MPVYIPQEIVDIIIGCATANASGLKQSYLRVEDLQNFSKYASVSHTFHQIVLPYEFKSLTFKFHREASIDMIFLAPISSQSQNSARLSMPEIHMPFLLRRLYRS